MASGKDLCLWSALNFNFYIKASLKTVFLAVPDVLAVRLTLDADFCVRGKVGELHSQQGLQVLGLQELAVVGVILQGKTGVAAQAEILHVSNFILIFVSLKTRGKRDVSGSQPHYLRWRTRLSIPPSSLRTCKPSDAPAQSSPKSSGTLTPGGHRYGSPPERTARAQANPGSRGTRS